MGLGNPGRGYAKTRHNLGFKVIDSLAKRLDVAVKKRKFGAKLGIARFEDKELVLLKPWRFMNRSGGPVAAAVNFYGLSLSDVLVVTDDMALEPGKIRLRAKGSAGGHNGLADIIQALGTEGIARLRIGIGRSNREDAVDYVLSRPTPEQKSLLDGAIAAAGDAVLCWVQYGIEDAMNKFN